MMPRNRAVAVCSAGSKRQGTGALQKLAHILTHWSLATASWSAAVLCRFSYWSPEVHHRCGHLSTIRSKAFSEKRQGTGALQKLAHLLTHWSLAEASWSAAVLCRFQIETRAFFQSQYTPVMPVPRTPWPHSPLHQLSTRGTYFVTASTYQKAHHFRGKTRLSVLQRGLLPSRAISDGVWKPGPCFRIITTS